MRSVVKRGIWAPRASPICSAVASGCCAARKPLTWAVSASTCPVVPVMAEASTGYQTRIETVAAGPMLPRFSGDRKPVRNAASPRLGS